VRRPVRLRLTEHTYPPEPRAERSWIPIVLSAFARVAERMPVRELLIIGTGNGLDVLGAAEIFDLDSIVVTDLLEESLAVAQDNVLSHLDDPGGIKLSFHSGDLLSCVPPEQRFSLVYENLPNLPAPPERRIDAGSNAGWFFDASEPRVPEPFQTYLLPLHYRCLQEARGRVHDRGGVLTAIAGRIPAEVAFGLHRACGYLPELVVFDVKIQSDPDVILPGYCRAEEESGVEFTFYDPEALEVVASGRRSGHEGQELADAVEDDLCRHAMSAHEAMDRTRRGGTVAHSVFMIFGEWREASPAEAASGMLGK
jgi:hypothetical protein